MDRLDRLERILIRCIEASDRERREKRKRSRVQTEKMASRADEWVQAQRTAQAQQKKAEKLRIVQDRTDRQEG